MAERAEIYERSVGYLLFCVNHMLFNLPLYLTFKSVIFFLLLSQATLTNILRIRARASLKIYNIYKLNSGYGKVFSEWSAIEKEMGDGLQVNKKNIYI